MYPIDPPHTAIVRDLSLGFLNSLKQNEPVSPIDMDRAYVQHQSYVNELKRVLKHVLILPADKSYPDCCFIEDTAVVVGRRALITRPGAVSRRGEVLLVEEVLRSRGLEISKMTEPAMLDGGDVLFTGRHLVVGLSKRTNQEAVQVLAKTFHEWPVVAVQVEESLHLKSVMSFFDHETLLFGECAAAHGILRELREKNVIAGSDQIMMLPDPAASNVLNLGETILVQEGFPRSEKILEELARDKKLKLRRVEMSEFIKADGALTCCSLLL